MKTILKIALPLIVVALGIVGSLAMILSRSTPEKRESPAVLPLVRVRDVVLDRIRLTVRSQGTVSPRTESELVPEVSGRIVEVSPSFEPGGFFEAGELLLRIDGQDYRQQLVQAGAAVTQAELRLAREQAEAEVALREWKELGQGEPTPLTLHEPQLADAEAVLAAARAARDKAQRDVQRTAIRAPYAGRVRRKQVDLGQFVNRGTPLATIYAVDYAEVRLPLADADLAYVDLPMGYRGDDERRLGPEVLLRADFAGRLQEWRGRIVRTEGVIDPKSRYVHTVARVKNPYGRGDDVPGRPPLAAGLFVEAEILGRFMDNAARLPRAALRDGNRVLVVDDAGRLRFRDVEVVRLTQHEAIVGAGLADGERVCLSTLAVVTDGMRVRVVEDDPIAASVDGS